MTWQFYGGTLDPEKMTRENSSSPSPASRRKLRTMMDGLDTLPPDQEARFPDEADREAESEPAGDHLGRNQILAPSTSGSASASSSTGSATSRGSTWNSRSSASFPAGRYDTSAAFNRDYFNDGLDAYARQNRGKPIRWPTADLNLVWLKVPDTAAVRPRGRPDRVVAALHHPGGQVRDGRLGHRRRFWRPFAI